MAHFSFINSVPKNKRIIALLIPFLNVVVATITSNIIENKHISSVISVILVFIGVILFGFLPYKWCEK